MGTQKRVSLLAPQPRMQFVTDSRFAESSKNSNTPPNQQSTHHSTAHTGSPYRFDRHGWRLGARLH
jgi:hypothetical protein